MTIGALLTEGEFRLHHRVSRRLECQLLLARVLGLSKETVFTTPEEEVDDEFSRQYFHDVDSVSQGRPVHHILGFKEFYGRPFLVSEDVLLPRPETEHLVEQVIRIVKENSLSVPRILDVGTGSGCIGISIALELPESRVTLSDISEKALKVAKKNLDFFSLNERVVVHESDLMNNFLDQEFDILVANLPYIGEDEFRFVAHDVEAFEPHVALFGGSDGLQLYKKMFQQIISMSRRPRWILGEFGFAQREKIESMLNTFIDHVAGSFSFVSDLAGIDRDFIVNIG